MKKYLIGSIFICIALYFLSSFAFPILGESIVVPLMIILLVIGGASVGALIIVFIKERFK